MLASEAPKLSIQKHSSNLSFTYTNLIKLIAFMSPFLVIFLMILISVFNNTVVKGLIFSIGLLIITFINYLLKSILKDIQITEASPFCNIFPFPFTIKENSDIYISPGLSTTIIGYLMGYLIFPMKINNELNPSLIIFLFALLIFNVTAEYFGKCVNFGGIILGTILGISFGILYYGLISVGGYKELAYFNEVSSNAVKCGKPSNKIFKCRQRETSSVRPQ